MTNTRKTLAVLLLLLLLLLAAVAIRRWSTRHADGLSTATTPVARGGSIVGSMRSDARSYNRYVENSAGTDLVTLLTQAPLVRVNRATDELEPWLAERWTASSDGRTYTLKLRAMSFSD